MLRPIKPHIAASETHVSSRFVGNGCAYIKVCAAPEHGINHGKVIPIVYQMAAAHGAEAFDHPIDVVIVGIAACPQIPIRNSNLELFGSVTHAHEVPTYSADFWFVFDTIKPKPHRPESEGRIISVVQQRFDVQCPHTADNSVSFDMQVRQRVQLLSPS